MLKPIEPKQPALVDRLTPRSVRIAHLNGQQKILVLPRKESRNRANELMETEIVLYDQKLAEALAATALCSYQGSPPKLDFGRGVEKIANFAERTIGGGNFCA